MLKANCSVEGIKATLPEISQRMFNASVAFSAAYTNEKKVPEDDPKHPARLGNGCSTVMIG